MIRYLTRCFQMWATKYCVWFPVFVKLTGVVSSGFVSPVLGIFSEPFDSAKACSRSFFCWRVRSNVAMSSAWTNFKISWESRLLFPSLSIVFCFSPWSLHHESKLVIIKKSWIAMYADNVECLLVLKRMIQSCWKFAYIAQFSLRYIIVINKSIPRRTAFQWIIEGMNKSLSSYKEYSMTI